MLLGNLEIDNGRDLFVILWFFSIAAERVMKVITATGITKARGAKPADFTILYYLITNLALYAAWQTLDRHQPFFWD